jgi:outer membrane receptor protein involved in Fe transport
MLGSRFKSLIAVASISLAAMAGTAFAQARNIDIPASDLKSALDAYISQTGVELVYKADDVSGLKNQSVRGSFTPEEALNRLLQGTGVTAQRGVTGAFVVGRLANNGEADAPGAVTEVVVVTGSRVIQDATNSPTPLAAKSAARLLTTTPSNLSDALNKLPIFQSSGTRRNAGGASANGGGEFLNLRAFGQQRTLVLLDNMRVPATNANGSVDVSTLPQMLMTRVDVVTGGASAVYGSDAITGVVNFILDKNFEGVKYNFNAGLSDYGDGLSYQGGIAAGTSLLGGRAHIEGSLQYYRADGILKRNRPGGAANWSSYGLGTAEWPITNIQQGRLNTHSFGGKITCTNCTVNSQHFVSSGVIGPFDAGTVPIVNGVASSVSSGGDGVFVDWTSAIAATKHAEAFARFSYRLNDDTMFWIQGMATEANVFNHFFPSQIDNGRQTTKYFKNNPFLSPSAMAQLGNNGLADATNIFNIQEWYDAPDRVRNTNAVTRSLVLFAGLNGQWLGRYDWEAHYTHGESRASVSGINNGNNQYHVAQQDAVIENGVLKCWNNTAAAIALYGDLYPGCVPLNPFGPNVTSDAAYSYWSRTTNFALTNVMDDLSASISGALFDLPAGPLRAALSGEMRWLDYTVNSNASPTALVDCTGLRLCGNPLTQTLWDNNTLASVAARQSVWEFSAEADIPLLADAPFVRAFDATLAGRYTDYSVSGPVQTWKVGLSWHVNEDLGFRGTTSIDIRAPTLNDLYAPTTSTSVGYFDLLTNFAGTGTQQVTQGNPNLVPEVARTYTIGVVLTPAFIPGLTASVDFYSINLRNAIGSVTGNNMQVQALCNNSGGTSPYCALYRRPIAFGQPGYNTPANYPTAVLSRNLNSAFQSTEGEDYEVNYHFNLADIRDAWTGAVTLSALVNVAPKINSNAFPGAQTTHTTNPKGHAAFFADYVVGNWAINAQIQWFSGLWKNGLLATPQVFAQPRVPSFTTVDLNVSKRIQFESDSEMQLYFSVQNVGNQNPPIVTGSSGNPGAGIPVPAGETVMGRYFTIGVRGYL